MQGQNEQVRDESLNQIRVAELERRAARQSNGKARVSRDWQHFNDEIGRYVAFVPPAADVLEHNAKVDALPSNERKRRNALARRLAKRRATARPAPRGKAKARTKNALKRRRKMIRRQGGQAGTVRS